MRQAFQFFHEQAGYCVGQRAVGALALARAEAALRDAVNAGTARIKWEYDPDPNTSWMDKRQRQEWIDGRTEMLECCLQTRCECCGHWQTVAALGGIHVYAGERDYLRVIEAELALEADL